MISETLDVIADAIRDGLPDVLDTLPGTMVSALATAGVAVEVTRVALDDKTQQATPLGVHVEQLDAVSESWPFEAQDEAPSVSVGVTCWVRRALMPGLVTATDDDTIRAVRSLCRAVSCAIRAELGRAGAVMRDGVQVRCPSSVTHGEPEMGDDGALTLMTLSLSVPVLDLVALSAGS